MNAEIMQITKNKNIEEKAYEKPRIIEEEQKLRIFYQLNKNMADLYFLNQKGEVPVEEYIDTFVRNTYIVLDLFNEMGVFPDYFYDIVTKYNIEYQKYAQNHNDKSDFELEKSFIPITNVSRAITEGMEKGYYKVQAAKDRTINDYFLEMIGIYQVFKLPYKISKEEYQKAFENTHFRTTMIMEELYSNVFIEEDVESLAKILFEYISFFAKIGYNPKELLDEYIDGKKAKRKK